jgi:hypothetical protein
MRETRQSFHYCLRQMHGGGVDLETARTDMLKRLEEYRRIVPRSRFKTVARYAAKAAPIIASMVLHFFAPGLPEIVFSGRRCRRWRRAAARRTPFPETAPDLRARPAALVHVHAGNPPIRFYAGASANGRLACDLRSRPYDGKDTG